jgi:glutamate dehydrogenase
LDPQFLVGSDFAQIPYAVFFLMGAEFQGFHVRFSDIARGGIRIIRSGDHQVYNHNLESQFQENYGLAFTQNLKNKDIPEFGSKGTVLLNPGWIGKDSRLVQRMYSSLRCYSVHCETITFLHSSVFLYFVSCV